MSNQQPYINYNNYAQYYNAQAPPQPAWAPQASPVQPSRPSWYDPRTQQQHSAQQSHQALMQGASYYNPNQYGSMPGASPAQAQASAPPPSLGVKYQQQAQQQQYQQQHEQKPALPPRPSSTTGRQDSPTAPYTAPYNAQTPSQWQARPNDALYTGTPSQTPSKPWGTGHAYDQSLSGVPPPPPPRPAAYQNQISHNNPDWPHEHYAQQPPSHYYEPSTNPHWTQALAGQQNTVSAGIGSSVTSHNNASGSQNQALVSPIDLMSSSWTQSGDAASQASLSHTTTYDHYRPVQTPLQGDPNFADHLPPQAATVLGPAGPLDWEYFAPDSHAVSPEITYSAPADLKSKASMADSAAVPVVDQTPTSQPSETQHDQHKPRSEGRATPQEEEDSSSDGPEHFLQRTGTIDSVIHAWNAPLKPRKEFLYRTSTSEPPSQHAINSTSINDGLTHAHVEGLRAETPTQQCFVAPVSDPYGDLEPQFRASLVRFVNMLRKESTAKSDEDKFKIFDNFVQKERRLRAILYDVDLIAPEPEVNRQDSLGKSGNVPTGAEARAQILQSQGGFADPPDKSLSVLAANQKQELPKTAAMSPKVLALKLVESPKSKDDSFVMVDRDQSDESAAYSPGGRPLIPRPITVNTQVDKAVKPAAEPTTAPSPSYLIPSPSDNAPQVVGEDYASIVPESPALAAPIVLASEKIEASPHFRMAATSNGPLSLPVKFEPPRPVYTPFRYTEGPQTPYNTLNVKRPTDEDYVTKRNAYDSNRLMANGTMSSPSIVESVTSPTTAKKMQEDTFIGLIRSHSTARQKQKPLNVPESIRPRTTPPATQMRPDPIKDTVQALRAALPPALPEKSQIDKSLRIRRRMEIFVDDFGFIRETVIPWDRDNRQVRKKLDEERHKRQEESETRLDELFNDNEIAYADLKGMEADFKLAEAERRYEEDKQELDSFTQGVYNVVTARLQQQVDELNKEYVLAVDLLDLESDPASRLLIGNGNRSVMSDAMELVLQLFEKLNIRYHKLAEARFERERRRKRLELTVLYTNGDSEGTKKLEKEFSTAEKLQVLHEARDKDQRASKLMDVFERATIRALGDNQAFLDELFAKVRRLNDVLPVDGTWQQNAAEIVYGEDGARVALASAQAVIDFVLADSRALLATSNAADKTLNDADYAVSVAEAKIADADETTHSKLKSDKEHEDGKLIEEMSIRMESIGKTPSDATHLIQEIVARIGNDKGHPERLKTALEIAKMRNVGKEL